MATKQIQRTMQIVDGVFVVTLNIPGDGVNARDLDKALQKVREMFFFDKDQGAVSQCM